MLRTQDALAVTPPILAGGECSTPMMECSAFAPPGWRVFAKLEYFSRTGSVKDRIAGPMIDLAEREGRLRPGMTIVEASSGNTSVALGAVAIPRGYRVVALIPGGMSPDKVARQLAYGVELWDCSHLPDGNSAETRRQLAKRLAADQPDRFCTLDQFANPANIWAQEHRTGREIVDQLSLASPAVERLDLFVAGGGTGGSLSGIARALASTVATRDARVVMADPDGSSLADMFFGRPVTPGRSFIPDGIGKSTWPPNLDRALIDDVRTIPRSAALEAALRFQRTQGLLVGPCAGYCLATILQVAETFGRLGDDGGRRSALVVISDRGEQYLSEPGYFGTLSDGKVVKHPEIGHLLPGSGAAGGVTSRGVA